MKQFFAHWVDLTALVIPVFIALYYSIRLAKQHPVRAVAAFFFMYAPLVILVHMFFHLFNISSGQDKQQFQALANPWSLPVIL